MPSNRLRGSTPSFSVGGYSPSLNHSHGAHKAVSGGEVQWLVGGRACPHTGGPARHASGAHCEIPYSLA